MTQRVERLFYLSEQASASSAFEQDTKKRPFPPDKNDTCDVPTVASEPLLFTRQGCPASPRGHYAVTQTSESINPH